MEHRRRWFVLVGVLLASVLVVAGCAENDVPQSEEPTTEPTAEATTEFTSPGGVVLTVETPRKDAAVTSPLEVGGRAPGSWSFEADFPIEILDADRRSVAEGYATIKGEWMTEDDVGFAGTIEFEAPPSASGFLVLHKANTSGLPKNDDAVEVPIRFER